MKWFKHMSAARRDPKIVNLRRREGREGVCRWWELVEMIAEQMNETDRCEIKINGAFLSRELGFRCTIDGRSFVDRLAIDQLLIADLSANDWVLKCPKLLELRDHRIKNRVHKSAPEQNRTDEDKNPPNPPVGENSGKPKRRSKNAVNGSGSTIDAWEMQWVKITGHLRTKGTSCKVEGISDRGLKALSMLGGMSHLAMGNQFTMPNMKKEFRIAYLSIEQGESK